MQLLFKKDEEEATIKVTQKIKGKELDFSYITMIRELMASGKMDKPDIVGDFAEPEKQSINTMVEYVNNAAAEAKAEDSSNEEPDEDFNEDEIENDNEEKVA